MPKTKLLRNWGNYPVIEAEEAVFSSETQLATYIQQQSKLIARGNGRCYGDASLQKHVISMLPFNKFLFFDETKGILEAEAGVLLADVLDFCVSKSWFLPVTPGTKFITLGGALAADVHGKNHHKEGCFSQHVHAFRLMDENGEIHLCSREENQELFWSTIGGMGLTGVIVSVRFSLKRIETAYIRQEAIKAENLDELMALFEASEDWTYTVAWMDCLTKGKHKGRAILYRGEHASVAELPSAKQQDPFEIKKVKKKQIPFYMPSFTINPVSVRLFNMLYYGKQFQKKQTTIIDYDTFFYPLDAIHNWNRIYGKNGFTQYQFVLPKAQSKEGLDQILSIIAEAQKGSFLVVLKLFGKADPRAEMSFPMEGYTLALDFKIFPDIEKFLQKMDEIVIRLGGRIYLAKDAFHNGVLKTSCYEKNRFLTTNENRKFSSLQYER